MAKARLLFTLGRSGSGKSYIQNLIAENYTDISYIPIYTDRPYRGSDDDKSHTLCITKEQMDDIISSNDALALKAYPVILPDGFKGEWRYCFLKSDFRTIIAYCNSEEESTKLFIVVSPTRQVFKEISEFLTDENDVMDIVTNPKKSDPRLFVDLIYVYRERFECIASSIRRGYRQYTAKYMDDTGMRLLSSDEQLSLDLMSMYQESCRRAIYSDDPEWTLFDNQIRLNLRLQTLEDPFLFMPPITVDRFHEPIRYNSLDVLCDESQKFVGFDIVINNNNYDDHIQEATINAYLQLIQIPNDLIETTKRYMPTQITYAFNHRIYNKDKEKIENS